MEIVFGKYKLIVIGILSFFLVAISGGQLYAQSATFSPVYEETSENVIQLGNSQVVEIRPVAESGSVLAEICADEDSDGSCRAFEKMMPFQPLCVQGQFTVDYKDGDANEQGNSVTVRKNSRIEVWEVTSPLAWYSGSRFVKNDRMSISKEFPVVPSASSYIDPQMARSLCAPGKDCEAFDDALAGVATGPFAVGAYAAGVADTQISADKRSPVVIRKRQNSYCPHIQDSNPNPDRTNTLAANLEPRFKMPGKSSGSRSYGAMSCEPEGIGASIASPSVYRSCVNRATPVDFITSARIAISQWFECLADEDECTDTELFAIRVDSLFGTQTQCAQGNCANSWFADVIKGGAPPGSESFVPEGVERTASQSFSEPMYVSTPCKVRIDGGRIEDIPCMWDVSPLREWYHRQRKMIGPSDPTFPDTFESYLRSVLFDVDRAGLVCEGS